MHKFVFNKRIVKLIIYVVVYVSYQVVRKMPSKQDSIKGDILEKCKYNK